MAQIIGLPKLSPTMEEGVLVRWVKKEGDSVEPGDLVAEVETDKANMDFNLEDEGVLLKLLVKEGDTVKLGAPVAILGEAGEDIAALVAEAAGGASAPSPTPAPSPAPAPVASSTPPAEPPPPPATSSASPAPGQALLASPLAKTLALELGIDIRQVKGTGPGGRIVERDVKAASQGATPAPPPPTGGTAAAPQTASSSTALAVVPGGALTLPGADGQYADKELTGMRKTIAERLTAAKRDIPHFRVTSSFDAAPMMLFRKRLNELILNSGGTKVSINDLLLKGVARTLRKVPEVNVAFMGDSIRYFTQVHIGVAVALDRGLITPVIRNADMKGIGVIGAEVRDLVTRAKNRQVKAAEIQGSTFTVSNLGMFGVDHFDAIINPPEAAILAVGRIRDEAVISDNQVSMAKRMTLTLSCDHRVVDGALGARFLDELVAVLEQPETLAL